MAKSSKSKKGNTQSKTKKAAVKATVNDTTSKKDAAEVKEAPATKTEAKETVAAKAAEAKEAAVKEVKEVAEKVKETTAKVKEEVKGTTAKAKEEVKKTTAKAKEEVKKQVEKKTAAKKEEAPKTRGRKPAAAKADTAKTAEKPAAKTTAKKTAKFEPEVIVQYQGNEAEQAEIVERIKAQFVSEGHRAGNIKSLKVYIKPEDGAAYYVINDKNAGKVNLF